MRAFQALISNLSGLSYFRTVSLLETSALKTPDQPILRFESLDSLRIQVIWKMISRNLSAVEARNTKNRFGGN